MGKDQRFESGFTLWEVLLVLGLMGLLLTAFTPHFGSSITHIQARVSQANIAKIEGAVQLYRIDVGVYPRQVQDLVNPPQGISGWCGPYLDEIPSDPFHSELNYKIDALGQVSLN